MKILDKPTIMKVIKTAAKIVIIILVTLGTGKKK